METHLDNEIYDKGETMKTLRILREKMQIISGDWNGEDKNFNSGGIVYNEDDAALAKDIVESFLTRPGDNF